MSLVLALVAAAASIGAFHSLAPDHWVPLGALARAERWSARRTVLVTASCGLGHVTVSAALGLLTLTFGLQALERVGYRLEGFAGVFLITFGIVYGLWGLHRSIGARWHAHDHSTNPQTAWTLMLLFSADPCVALLPIIFAAAPAGWMATFTVIAAYEVATIGTMIAYHADVARQMYAACALESIIGRDELSETERRYLDFGEAFERRFLHQQPSDAHTIDETLSRAWRSLGELPVAELTRLPQALIDRYLRPSC